MTVDNNASNTGRVIPKGWASGEIRYLREHAADGAEAIAAHLGRTVRAVQQQAVRQRVSLRRPGVRRGLLLGQPRGVSWKHLRADGLTPAAIAEIRAMAASRMLDLSTVEAQLRIVANGETRPLCPACTARPADHLSGVCRVCHLRALAQAHKDTKTTDAAQRELWAERQRKKRRKDHRTP